MSDSNLSAARYHLYEYDPCDGNDDYVGYADIMNGECKTFTNIGKFVDGDNNKAEFYVVYSGLATPWYASFWDWF